MFRDSRQRRELKLTLDEVFSSIASIELQKAVFLFLVRRLYNWDVFAKKKKKKRALVDKRLCRLVDQLCATGYHDAGGYNFTTILPGFREKGVVTLIYAARDDRVLHCSARSR